jgi:hypothetical protein
MATAAYMVDIQVALLRSRYYHAQYLVHRPFVYKAMHQPEAVTREDAAGAAACLRACLRWPITMVPASQRKRLLPCVFFWTQNVLGVLVLLHATTAAAPFPLLARIRSTPALCGSHFEADAADTVAFCLDWLRDFRRVDTAAEWAWQLLRGLYGLEE